MSEAWPCLELQQAGVSVLDCEHKTPPDAGTGYPYVAIPNLRGGRIDFTGVRRITEGQFLEWTRRTLPQTDDIIVTRRGRVGDTAVVPPGVDLAIGQNLVIIRSTSPDVDQGFLRWAAQGPQWYREVQRLLNVGAVFDSLNVRDIGRIRISVPPPSEQRAIAEVLGALDDKIQASERTVLQASQILDTLYARETVDSSPIKSSLILEPILGGTPSRGTEAYWGGTIPWASAKDVGAAEEGVLIQTAECISELGLAESPAKLVSAGTTLITARGTVGRIARAVSSTSFNQTCYALVPKDDFPPLLLYLAVKQGLDGLRSLTYGTVFATITKQTFDVFLLKIPTQARRSVLAQELSAYDEVILSLYRESQILAELRNVLLPKLLSGEVRIRDAEGFVEEAV
jgi:type I restriction enzyme S subunit